MMKTLLSISFLFFINYLHAQVDTFNKTSALIQEKIQCCSVPFSASNSARVDSISIEPGGEVTLFYSDKRKANSFNIFKLYKETEGHIGIDTILRGKFIQFNVTEKTARLIRFATAEDAKEVYNAFSRLVQKSGTESMGTFKPDFKQTLADINNIVDRWAESRNTIHVSALANGDVVIEHNRNQFFNFNLFQLKATVGTQWEGIEIKACEPRSHAPIAWINFETPQGNVAFIRMECDTPQQVLEQIKTSFLHLKALSKNTLGL